MPGPRVQSSIYTDFTTVYDISLFKNPNFAIGSTNPRTKIVLDSNETIY
jgi:hypothetical protein